MHSVLAFAAPLALMLPLVAEALDVPEEAGVGADVPAPQSEAASAQEPAAINPLSAMRQSTVLRQVRIEQRVVVRITPQPGPSRQNLTAEVPERPPAPRFEERGKEKCVPLADIAGVQTGSGDRLVLFLRDRRMIAVNLEKACRARDFYAGFYVERNKDGQLCVERDKLQSRTGAQCEVETMRQLVQVRS
ncbi:hypothetical protein [Erythrobacter colymbi]|uniref:hypothetical protein n=1 Tax=Erythrobacter colymbi TaxID=1161202 RepID=UPI000A3ABC43|nr:hypothetical protein [Erythrobacter colymbi]